MKNVIKWLSEYALAEKDAIGGPEVDKRVTALREMENAQNMTPTQFQEVMTTAHFNYYFSDALSRMFYKDYEYKVGDWPKYTFQDTAPDFRDVKRWRMTEPGTLYRRREKAEAKTTYVHETEVHYGVEEYARQFDVSWQTIQNDDLGKIKETPSRMANAAARWADAFVSNLYDNGVTQAWIAGLGVPWSGTGRLTLANLAIGVNAMMQRTDAAGNQMNIKKVFLVIPPILKIQAAQILQDILSYGGLGSNVMAQFVSGVYTDPYIATAGINVPWYLFADPAEIAAVSVVRLQGWTGPVVAMKRSDIQLITGSAPSAFTMGSFATGDIEYVVEDVLGGWDDTNFVGVTDFRGFYYSSGTTA